MHIPKCARECDVRGSEKENWNLCTLDPSPLQKFSRSAFRRRRICVRTHCVIYLRFITQSIWLELNSGHPRHFPSGAGASKIYCPMAIYTSIYFVSECLGPRDGVSIARKSTNLNTTNGASRGARECTFIHPPSIVGLTDGSL